jgi:hypothetical protein
LDASVESLCPSIAVTAKAATDGYTTGGQFTTLKDRKKEIGPGLLNAMLTQLGLTRADLEN